MSIALGRIAAAILPIVAQVVQSTEDVHSDLPGEVKKQIAVGAIKTIYDHTGPDVPFEQVADQALGLIDMLVTTYNSMGKFVKAVKEFA